MAAGCWFVKKLRLLFERLQTNYTVNLPPGRVHALASLRLPYSIVREAGLNVTLSAEQGDSPVWFALGCHA